MKARLKKESLSILKIKGEHIDCTKQISLICLERALKRIKSQLDHSAKSTEEELSYCDQVKGNLDDFKIIKRAIQIIKHY